MKAMDGVALLIDNFEYGQKKAKEVLEDIGSLSVIEVSNKSFLSSVLNDLGDIKLIILDIEFPKAEEGFEILSKIRRNNSTAHVPIIITTKLDKKEYKSACLEYNVNDYIAKPYNPDRLKSSILSVIKIKKDFEYDFSSIVNITLTFEEFITKELKYSLRANHSFSMIVIRPVIAKSNSLTHNFSEIVRLNVPDKIKHALRSTDTVFLNTNGDMFIILPCTDTDKAKMVNTKLEEILKGCIADAGIHTKTKYISSFITFPDEGDNLKSLLEAAFRKIENKKALEAMTTVLESVSDRARIIFNRYKK